MSFILAFANPLEYILRYTVLAGIAVAVIGAAICFMAKRITMAKRNVAQVDKQDKLYVTLLLIGISLILIGMIVMVLPIEGTFYKV